MAASKPALNQKTDHEIQARLNYVIARAKRIRRVRDGLVLCDNCDTPASRSLAIEMSWVPCAPCCYGEADSFDPGDVIFVGPK